MKGYCSLVFGESYAQEFNNLVATINKNDNHTPISVITSKEYVSLLNVNLIDKIIIYKFDHPFYNENLTNFEKFCLIPRLVINEYIPYDQTILIDTDMLCQSNPDNIWDIMQNIDQAVVLTGVRENKSWHWGYINEIEDFLQKKIFSCNGGFIYINKNHKDINTYFKLLKFIYTKYDDFKLKRFYQNGRVDEPLFSIVNSILDYDILENHDYSVVTYFYENDFTIPVEYPSRLQTYPFLKQMDDHIPFIHMFKPHGANYNYLLNKILTTESKKMNEKNLTQIMDFYGSDKGSISHNYTSFYETLFNRTDNINIFELGIGTNNINIPSSMGANHTPGASARAWKDYFLNANIYSADIDKDILFSEERIKTYYVDQTNQSSIDEMWNNEDLKNITFDLIIDDGLHEVDAAFCFLKNSFNKLKMHGYYIIEDVIIHYLYAYKDFLEKLKIEYNFSYEIKLINDGINVYGGQDNCLIVIRKCQ